MGIFFSQLLGQNNESETSAYVFVFVFSFILITYHVANFFFFPIYQLIYTHTNDYIVANLINSDVYKIGVKIQIYVNQCLPFVISMFMIHIIVFFAKGSKE